MAFIKKIGKKKNFFKENFCLQKIFIKIFSKTIIILGLLFIIYSVSGTALIFTGGDKLNLCVITPDGNRTYLNNTNLTGINITDLDITLELYDLEKERSYITIHDLFFNNILDFFFLLIVVLFVILFIYGMLQ